MIGLQVVVPCKSATLVRAGRLLGKGHVQIRTDRLLLREFTLEDEQAYLVYQADPRSEDGTTPNGSSHARCGNAPLRSVGRTVTKTAMTH